MQTIHRIVAWMAMSVVCGAQTAEPNSRSALRRSAGETFNGLLALLHDGRLFSELQKNPDDTAKLLGDMGLTKSGSGSMWAGRYGSGSILLHLIPGRPELTDSAMVRYDPAEPEPVAPAILSHLLAKNEEPMLVWSERLNVELSNSRGKCRTKQSIGLVLSTGRIATSQIIVECVRDR